MTKFCISCGKPMVSGAKFCGDCGGGSPVVAMTGNVAVDCDDDAAAFRAYLRQYKEHQKMYCLDCGYQGTMGVFRSNFPWYLHWGFMLLICFTGIGCFVVFALMFLREARRRRFARCPQCASVVMEAGGTCTIADPSEKPSETKFENVYGVCETDFIKNMTDDQRQRFLTGVPNIVKNPAMAFILCRVFGIFGAHKFYLGKPLEGVLYLVTLGGCGMLMIYDIFTISGQVRRLNFQRARLLADEIEGRVNPGIPSETVTPISQAGTLSPLNAGLFALPVVLFVGVVGLYDWNAAKLLYSLIAFGTATWAAIDSYRLKLRENNSTQLAMNPILFFIAMYVAGIVLFPWYLVVRSRILAERSPVIVSANSGTSSRKPLLFVGAGVLALVLLVVVGSAALWVHRTEKTVAASPGNNSAAPVAVASTPEPIAAAGPTSKENGSPAPISGTYRMKGTMHHVTDSGQIEDQSRTGLLEVVVKPGGNLTFSLNAALVLDVAAGDVRTGELEGEVTVRNGEAVYVYDHGEYDKCKITMIFGSDRVELKQEQECGFGVGVDANGTYARVSSEVPSVPK